MNNLLNRIFEQATQSKLCADARMFPSTKRYMRENLTMRIDPRRTTTQSLNKLLRLLQIG